VSIEEVMRGDDAHFTDLGESVVLGNIALTPG
jgi:hypothetical protein